MNEKRVFTLAAGATLLLLLNCTTIQQAAYHGNLNTIKEMIQAGADLNQPDKNGWTPLMHASSRGHLDIVRYMVEKGANLKYRTKTGLTSLMAAAAGGKMDVADYLIIKGCDIKAKTTFNMSAFSYAAYNNHPQVVCFMLTFLGTKAEKKQYLNDAFLIAAKYNKTKTAIALADAGADIHSRDNDGNSAYVYSFLNANGQLKKVLIQKGANASDLDQFCFCVGISRVLLIGEHKTTKKEARWIGIHSLLSGKKFSYNPGFVIFSNLKDSRLKLQNSYYWDSKFIVKKTKTRFTGTVKYANYHFRFTESEMYEITKIIKLKKSLY